MRINWGSRRTSRAIDAFSISVWLLLWFEAYGCFEHRLWFVGAFLVICGGLQPVVVIFRHVNARRLRRMLYELNAAQQIEEHFRHIDPWDTKT